MTIAVCIVSRSGLRIGVYLRNQPNKTKLALYKLLISLYESFKQLYMSEKIEHGSYEEGCGMHVLRH